ncbi:hypothetical protein [Streptomyces sp. SID3343]|uniref:hypothetical protein n=1 Tax=Streptomyces sp. SID3343 TaxID=2690260 RepID=UPI00136F4877|nr:hypothetical protein [Streptomyces sp. SID3343]MYW00234.1 hypothetical protein [Streptomyces sp. SID3343]
MTAATLTRPARIVYTGRDARIRVLLPRVVAAIRAEGLDLPDTTLSTKIGPANLDRGMLAAVRMATGQHDGDPVPPTTPIGPWAADRSGGAVTTPAWRGSAEIVLDRAMTARMPEDDVIRLLGHHLVHAAQLHAAGPAWVGAAAHHIGLKALSPQWVARRRDQLAADELAAQALVPAIAGRVRDEIPTLF